MGVLNNTIIRDRLNVITNIVLGYAKINGINLNLTDKKLTFGHAKNSTASAYEIATSVVGHNVSIVSSGNFSASATGTTEISSTGTLSVHSSSSATFEGKSVTVNGSNGTATISSTGNLSATSSSGSATLKGTSVIVNGTTATSGITLTAGSASIKMTGGEGAAATYPTISSNGYITISGGGGVDIKSTHATDGVFLTSNSVVNATCHKVVLDTGSTLVATSPGHYTSSYKDRWIQLDTSMIILTNLGGHVYGIDDPEEVCRAGTYYTPQEGAIYFKLVN